jgi:antitoxin CptB
MGHEMPSELETRNAELSRQRRLHWRCRRGMLELDILLADFLQRGYGALDARQRSDFERLLALPDQELLEYLLGVKQTTDGDLAHVIARIRHSAVP